MARQKRWIWLTGWSLLTMVGGFATIATSHQALVHGNGSDWPLVTHKTAHTHAAQRLDTNYQTVDYEQAQQELLNVFANGYEKSLVQKQFTGKVDELPDPFIRHSIFGDFDGYDFRRAYNLDFVYNHQIPSTLLANNAPTERQLNDLLKKNLNSTLTFPNWTSDRQATAVFDQTWLDTYLERVHITPVENSSQTKAFYKTVAYTYDFKTKAIPHGRHNHRRDGASEHASQLTENDFSPQALMNNPELKERVFLEEHDVTITIPDNFDELAVQGSFFRNQLAPSNGATNQTGSNQTREYRVFYTRLNTPFNQAVVDATNHNDFFPEKALLFNGYQIPTVALRNGGLWLVAFQIVDPNNPAGGINSFALVVPKTTATAQSLVPLVETPEQLAQIYFAKHNPKPTPIEFSNNYVLGVFGNGPVAEVINQQPSFNLHFVVNKIKTVSKEVLLLKPNKTVTNTDLNGINQATFAYDVDVSQLLQLNVEDAPVNGFTLHGKKVPNVKIAFNEQIVIPAYQLALLKKLYNEVATVKQQILAKLASEKIDSDTTAKVTTPTEKETNTTFENNWQIAKLNAFQKDIVALHQTHAGYQQTWKQIKQELAINTTDQKQPVPVALTEPSKLGKIALFADYDKLSPIGDDVQNWDADWNVIYDTFHGNNIHLNYQLSANRPVVQQLVWDGAGFVNPILFTPSVTSLQNLQFVNFWYENKQLEINKLFGLYGLAYGQTSFVDPNKYNFLTIANDPVVFSNQSLSIPLNQYLLDIHAQLQQNNSATTINETLLTALNNKVFANNDVKMPIFSRVSWIEEKMLTAFNNWPAALEYFGLANTPNPLAVFNGVADHALVDSGQFYALAVLPDWHAKQTASTSEQQASTSGTQPQVRTYSNWFVHQLQANPWLYELQLADSQTTNNKKKTTDGYFLIKLQTNKTLTNLTKSQEDLTALNITNQKSIRFDVNNPLGLFNTTGNNQTIKAFYENKNNFIATKTERNFAFNQTGEQLALVSFNYAIDPTINMPLVLNNGLKAQYAVIKSDLSGGMNHNSSQQPKAAYLPALEQDFLKRLYEWNVNLTDAATNTGKIVSLQMVNNQPTYVLNPAYQLQLTINEDYQSDLVLEYTAHLHDKNGVDFTYEINSPELKRLFDQVYLNPNHPLHTNYLNRLAEVANRAKGFDHNEFVVHTDNNNTNLAPSNRFANNNANVDTALVTVLSTLAALFVASLLAFYVVRFVRKRKWRKDQMNR